MQPTNLDCAKKALFVISTCCFILFMNICGCKPHLYLFSKCSVSYLISFFSLYLPLWQPVTRGQYFQKKQALKVSSQIKAQAEKTDIHSCSLHSNCFSLSGHFSSAAPTWSLPFIPQHEIISFNYIGWRRAVLWSSGGENAEHCRFRRQTMAPSGLAVVRGGRTLHVPVLYSLHLIGMTSVNRVICRT